MDIIIILATVISSALLFALTWKSNSLIEGLYDQTDKWSQITSKYKDCKKTNGSMVWVKTAHEDFNPTFEKIKELYKVIAIIAVVITPVIIILSLTDNKYQMYISLSYIPATALILYKSIWYALRELFSDKFKGRVNIDNKKLKTLPNKISNQLITISVPYTLIAATIVLNIIKILQTK